MSIVLEPVRRQTSLRELEKLGVISADLTMQLEALAPCEPVLTATFQSLFCVQQVDLSVGRARP